MTPVFAHRLRGDRAFERIYRRHVGDVYRYTLAVLRNPADAEDVTQTTFMNAYRAYEAGERPRQPQNWLIAIAHNVCRQRFRQSQRRVEEVAFEDSLTEAVVADDEAPTAEDIRRALGHLAFNQRAALVMRELEGRSYAEIAELMDISVSAVETLIFRARRALREQLEGRLTCREAELAISKQLDRRLARTDRGPLRAHLRECAECGKLARKLRAQRTAIRTLGLVPVPSSLGSLFGGAAAGSAAWGLGGGLAVKAAVGLAAAALVAGGSYEVVREVAAEPAAKPPAERPVRAQRGPVEGVRGNREVPPRIREESTPARAEGPPVKAEKARPAAVAVAREKPERAQPEKRAKPAKAKPAKGPKTERPAKKERLRAATPRVHDRAARPVERKVGPPPANGPPPAKREKSKKKVGPGGPPVVMEDVPTPLGDPMLDPILETPGG